jgi:hypothetical protein
VRPKSRCQKDRRSLISISVTPSFGFSLVVNLIIPAKAPRIFKMGTIHQSHWEVTLGSPLFTEVPRIRILGKDGRHRMKKTLVWVAGALVVLWLLATVKVACHECLRLPVAVVCDRGNDVVDVQIESNRAPHGYIERRAFAGCQ